MVFIFKTHPFNMSFKEIKAMTFKQAMLMVAEYQSLRQERQAAVESILKRSKDTMPTFDVTRGIYE
jgi:hypothetical protein